MMGKLFLFAVLASLLFAVPLAFATASDGAASAGVSISDGAPASSSSGGSPSPSAEGAPSGGAAPSDAKGSSGGSASPGGIATTGGSAAVSADTSPSIKPLPAVKPAPTPLPAIKPNVSADAVAAPPKNGTNSSYSVVVLPPFANLSIGQSQQFDALLVVNGGIPADVPFTWSTTGGVGTIGASTGLFIATAAGSGLVIATPTFTPAGMNVSGTASVLVTNSPPPPPGNNSTAFSLFIVPPNATLNVNGTQQFLVYAQLANGTIMQVQNSALSWSTAGGIGTVSPTGLFAATAAGAGTVSATYSGPMPVPAGFNATVTALVTVNNSPPPPPGNSSYYLMISPASATLLVGATQQFAAQLYDTNGTYIYNVPNSDLAWLSSNTTVGTIDALGVFSAVAPGSALVKAAYTGSAYSNVTSQNVANVTVNATPPPANVSYIKVTPNPASLFTGQSQQFIATAYDSGNASLGVLPNSNLSWSVTPGIGAIGADGVFNATAVGSGMVTAFYTAMPGSNISDTAAVAVSQFVPNPNGGGSGTGSGGGSYKTSTTVSFSCAGKPGTVKITVFDSNVQNATVDIFYLGDTRVKVFTQEITGSTSLSFSPEKAGDYELHVSVGADQTSARFFVPYCGAQPTNVTQNITVRLQPSRELLFTKLVNYPGGFSKLFSVYKITDGQNVNYESDIVLYFNYTGNSTKYGFDVLDGVPSSVIARSSQITFADRPSSVSSEPSFEWHVSSIAKGGRLSYAYSFARPLTEQMIGLFAAPTIRSSEPAPAGAAQGGSLLAASIGPIFGITLPVVAVVLGFVLLLALLYFFLFAKRKEE